MLNNKLYSSIIESLLVNENLISQLKDITYHTNNIIIKTTEEICDVNKNFLFTNSHIKKKPIRPEFMTPLAVKMNVKL